MENEPEDLPPGGDPPFEEWPEDAWPPIPDHVDLVQESAGMLAIGAADHFRRIDHFHAEAVALARHRGEKIDQVFERGVRLELAQAIASTESSAGLLLWRAELLVRRHPAVLDSLGSAQMTERHATAIVEAVAVIGDDRKDALVDRAIDLAERLPLGKFRKALRRLIDEERVDTLAERHEQAIERRSVVLEPAADGMAFFGALMPAVEAQAGFNRISAQAKALLKQCPDDMRTLDQARADVFGDILLDGVTDALPPNARGIRPTVAVTVPVLALLEMTDAGGDAADGRVGADGRAGTRGYPEVDGVGPIPIDVARQLCGAATGWMRVLTEPETGVVLSVGREQYRPPESLRRLVRWRAETCMAPGCNIPADRCEIDHTIPWDDGGETELANLAPLCKGHHDVKGHSAWSVIQREDGTMEWTSPSGRRYRVDPPRKVPTFVPDTDEEKAPF